MAIRLETSKGTGIENFHDTDIPPGQRRWATRSLPSTHRPATSRTKPSPLYNCHGLVFASRRTRVVDTKCLSTIFQDDKYQQINLKDVLPGDIVIYVGNDGDYNHSGIVLSWNKDAGELYPTVLSKWGHASEYIHALTDVPAQYGPNHLFFRCLL